MKSKNKYFLPVLKNKIVEIVKGESPKAPAHVIGKDFNPPFGDDRRAIDYYCPKGTPVMAASDGKIIWVKNDSHEGGRDKKYIPKANGVAILHKNNEISNYLHLMPGSIVRNGQSVKKGEIIGYVGMTGWTPAPHLHFSVMRITGKNPFKDYVTLEINL